MNDRFHVQFKDGCWMILAGGLIIWARCTDERYAKRIAELLNQHES